MIIWNFVHILAQITLPAQSLNTLSGAMPVSVTAVPVSVANFTTDYTAINQILQKPTAEITEIFNDKDDNDDNGDESSAEMVLPSMPMNRRNSMSTAALAANRELVSRKVSNSSHSTDSPNLPKRNQPITSSAPSTLTKTKAEQKTGEVYV